MKPASESKPFGIISGTDFKSLFTFKIGSFSLNIS